MPISTTKGKLTKLMSTTPSLRSLSTKQNSAMRVAYRQLSHARGLPPTWCESFQPLLAFTHALTRMRTDLRVIDGTCCALPAQSMVKSILASHES